jgi:hypothetical protein
VRTLTVAMRKKNLSVYDIQRELAEAAHTISINALTVLLRGLGGHLKTGQLWTGQNRPVGERSQA